MESYHFLSSKQAVGQTHFYSLRILIGFACGKENAYLELARLVESVDFNLRSLYTYRIVVSDKICLSPDKASTVFQV